jgi:hypothetical protein
MSMRLFLPCPTVLCAVPARSDPPNQAKHAQALLSIRLCNASTYMICIYIKYWIYCLWLTSFTSTGIDLHPSLPKQTLQNCRRYDTLYFFRRKCIRSLLITLCGLFLVVMTSFSFLPVFLAEVIHTFRIYMVYLASAETMNETCYSQKLLTAETFLSACGLFYSYVVRPVLLRNTKLNIASSNGGN